MKPRIFSSYNSGVARNGTSYFRIWHYRSNCLMVDAESFDKLIAYLRRLLS